MYNFTLVDVLISPFNFCLIKVGLDAAANYQKLSYFTVPISSVT